MSGRERIVQLLRALAALLALAALVAGPPILLARAVGWPLPSKLPTVDELRNALGGSTIADGTILKALALVCWAAWIQIAISAAVEVHAWVTGTVSSRIPFGGLVQPVVRQLVISGALFFAAVRSAQPVEPALATATSAVAVMPAPAAAANAPATADVREVAPAPASASTITVQPRDSLWRVAERHLGDGMRWRELWDLNRGRSFPDGRTFSNPNLIQPGWVLTCPPDATDVDRTPLPADAPQAPAPSEPPATTVDPPVDTTLPAAPTAPHSTAPAHSSSVGDSSRATAAQAHHSSDNLAVELITGSLLAAGFVAMLDRLRRVQLRRREPGRAPRPPDEKTVETETRLRLSAVEAPAERLDLALRALAACLAQSKAASVPAIELVSVGPDAVEVLLTADPDATPGPFDVSPDGRAWTLTSASPLDEITALAAGQAAPSPTLVSIGVIDERQVLVDLESLPHLLVTGDQAVGHRLIWSAAVEMSTSPWVDDLELVVVTDRPTPLGDLDRVTVVAGIDDALARVQSTVIDTKRDLDLAGTTSTLASRVRNPADPWTPLAVLVPDVPDGPSLRRLVEAVPPNAGACILAASPEPLDSAHVLRVDSQGATLLPVDLHLGLACWPDEVAADADALLSCALTREDVDLLEETEPAAPASTYVPRSPFSPEADGVLVCVLGAVEVRGAERTIDRRRSLELVTYLSLHPEGIDEARLRCVLWPDGDPSRENFNQTVSRARQPLGHAADGRLHFPRLVDDGVALYRLGCSVTTDAALLEDALRAASREPSDTSLEHLASMLSLIRGLPFEGTKGGWEWTFTEGHAARLAALAAEAAHAVAQWSIDNGEVQRALWAASQGLRAAPGDEVLYRDRMQAHDRAGNLGGVESVMKELRGIVDDGEPYDAIHPDTVAYYEELTGRVRRIG